MAHEFEIQESDNQYDIRPNFHIGQHDSIRNETLSHLQYGQILNSGVSYKILFLFLFCIVLRSNGAAVPVCHNPYHQRSFSWAHSEAC